MELDDERRARRARVRVVQREHAELRERALEVVLLDDDLLAQHLHGHHLRTAIVARLGARLGQHYLRAANAQRPSTIRPVLTLVPFLFACTRAINTRESETSTVNLYPYSYSLTARRLGLEVSAQENH